MVVVGQWFPARLFYSPGDMWQCLETVLIVMVVVKMLLALVVIEARATAK